MTEQGQSTEPERKRIKGRSPSYPGITLSTAIQRARVLYEKEKTHPAPIGVVARHWGYKSHTTGPASVTYAALIKYGLMADEGSGDARQAKLTDLAVKILMSPDPTERAEATRTAALKPPIHTEMWEQYGADLPTDDTLHYQMAVTGPFTESGFQDFIRVYRDVIDFANLADGGKIESSHDDASEEVALEDGPESERNSEEPRGPRRGEDLRRVGVSNDLQTLAVPMLNAPPVIIEGHFPLSEAEWTYFMAVLTAMKTGLVREQKNGGHPDE